jgi:very-short-patch-repair endonuclease
VKRINPTYLINSRRLRKDQTDVEKLLWYHLRGRNISGIKFRRQHKLGPYIVDFVSIEKKIIIELDGGQHNSAENLNNDAARDLYLKKLGFKVLRFWNNEVLQNFENVLERINNVALYPHPDPLPKRERE